MRPAAPALLAAALAAPAHAGVYLTGSVRANTLSSGYLHYDTRGGGAGLQLDLNRYFRIGFTHEQQVTTVEGYEDPDSRTTPDRDGDGTRDSLHSYNRSHVISNSVDLQLALCQCQLFLPYVLAGVIEQTMTTRTLYYDENIEPVMVTEKSGPSLGPNLGLGIGIRLSKDFTFKVQYTATLGTKSEPGVDKTTTVVDKRTSLGLSYQL